MSEDTYTFVRPHRTLMMKLINKLGRRHPPKFWSAEEIVDRAVRQTKVESWDDHFVEPLEVLVRSFEEDADLSPIGTLVIRQILVRMVAKQVDIQRTLRQQPDLLNEKLECPLIIVGMPRTGTTLLYNLLAQHPNARPLLYWETLDPRPAQTGMRNLLDTRKLRSHLYTFHLKNVAPQLEAIHPLDPTGPEESTLLMMYTLVCPAFMMLGRIPRYMRWHRSLTTEDLVPRYHMYENQLKMMQRGAEPRRWVLKSPALVETLDALLSALPDARVVQTHRDPKNVLPSLASLLAVFRGIFSDRVDPLSLDEEMYHMEESVDKAMRARDKHPDRVYDVRFGDLVRDPVGVARGIHDHFGIEWDQKTAQAMERWLRENASDKYGKHRYDMDQFGLTAEEIDERFAEYIERYLGPD